MSETYKDAVIKSKETQITETIKGSHSKKTLRKQCRKFKTEHQINGYASAHEKDTDKVIVDFK